MGYSNYPNGLTSLGVPLPAGNGLAVAPVLGNVYFVNGARGDDNNSGRSKRKAFETIQAAITKQIADASGLGDVIYILPGTYEETLTGDLSKVSIIGVNCGGNSHAVSIRPDASYCWTGKMTDAAWRNIMFVSAKTTNQEHAVLLPTYMGYSVIDNCLFIARTDAAVTALQIGSPTDQATAVKMDFSAITNCTIGSFYGKEFTYGIQHSALTNTNIETKQMTQSVIAGNNITAATTGITIGIHTNKGYGSVIRNNIITSPGITTSGLGCTSYGIASVDGQNGVLVVSNYIKAVSDCIYNFADENVFDNYVSLNGASPVAELPTST